MASASALTKRAGFNTDATAEERVSVGEGARAFDVPHSAPRRAQLTPRLLLCPHAPTLRRRVTRPRLKGGCESSVTRGCGRTATLGCVACVCEVERRACTF